MGQAGQSTQLDLPPTIKMDTLVAIERALAGDDPDELRKALGEGGAELRDGVVAPFLAGFKKRELIDKRLKDMANSSVHTAQPGALAAPQPLGGFGAKPAQPATPAAAGADDVELAAFSYGRLFTAVPGDASVRVVAPHEDWARVGRPDLPGKAIPQEELAPVLALASTVARTLRENLCRCLQLVAAARATAPGADDEQVRRRAVRLYFAEQQRILTLICRLLREPSSPDLAGDDGAAWRAVLLEGVCRLLDAGSVAGAKVELVGKIGEAMLTGVDKFASADLDERGGQNLRAKVRQGRQDEMRLLCEVVLEVLSRYDTPQQEVKLVAQLYKRWAGREEPVVVFYSSMLAAALASALLRPSWRAEEDPAGPRQGVPRQGALSPGMATQLERDADVGGGCNKELEELPDAEPDVAKGFLQLLLACAETSGRLVPPPTPAREVALLPDSPHGDLHRTLRHAVFNRGIAYVEGVVLPCAALDRWGEYRERICRAMECVVLVVLNEMRELVEEALVAVEQHFPERKHETLTALLRAAAQCYQQLPAKTCLDNMLDSSHLLGQLKRWVVRTISQEQDPLHLYRLKSAFMALLCALFKALAPDGDPDGAEARAAAAAWGGEHALGQDLLRLMDQLMDPLQAAPEALMGELQTYTTTVADSLGLRGITESETQYILTVDRQRMLCEGSGHSEGEAYLRQWQHRGQRPPPGYLQQLEHEVVEFLVQGLRLLRAIAACADPEHPELREIRAALVFSPAYLAENLLRKLWSLWREPLCPAIKAELVLAIDAVVRHADSIGPGGAEVVRNIWEFFVRDTALQCVYTLDKVEYSMSHIRTIPGPVTALYAELMDIDRARGAYEHTLAFLQLLNSVMDRRVFWEEASLEVLHACVALLPPMDDQHGESIAAFRVPAQRWKIYTGVLRLLHTMVHNMFSLGWRSGWRGEAASPVARALFEQVLSWVVQAGAGNAPRVRQALMSLLSRGLVLAEELEDQGALPQLAVAIETALALVNIAVSVSAQAYGSAELVDAILAERGRSLDDLSAPARSLTAAVLHYTTLEDEPRLARAALELLQQLCAQKDQEVLQVLASDTSEAEREEAVAALASWLLAHGPHRDIAATLMQLLLDSLASAGPGGCTAHLLLGFAPAPVSPDLAARAGRTALLRVVCQTAELEPWVNDARLLRAVRDREARPDEDGDAKIDEGAGLPATRAEQLEAFQRRQHCLEVIFRLCESEATRDAMLRLLLTPNVFTKPGLGEGSDCLLLKLASSMPGGFSFGGHAEVLARARDRVRALREGELLAVLEIPDVMLNADDLKSPATDSANPGRVQEATVHAFRRIWRGPQLDVPDHAVELEVEKVWESKIEEWERGGGAALEDNLLKFLYIQREQIWFEEMLLDDLLEPSLHFSHQAGWFLRTAALILNAERAGTAGVVSRERVQALLRELLGEPQRAAQRGAAPPVGGAGGGTSAWVGGKIQRLLGELLDVPEVEGAETEEIHPLLGAAEVEECATEVDRWTGNLTMADEKLLQDLLFRRLQEQREQTKEPVSDRELYERAVACVRAKLLGAYSGSNTVARCRSAREHLLCGVQDVLEEALGDRDRAVLVADTLQLDARQWHALLLNLLDTLLQMPRAKACLAYPHVAPHFTRLIAITVAAIAAPPPTPPPSDSMLGVQPMQLGYGQRAPAPSLLAEEREDGLASRALLLRCLPLLLALPTAAPARSGITLRADLYAAILRSLAGLRAPLGERDGSAGGGDGSAREAMEELLAPRRGELLRVAAHDLASPEQEPSPWDKRWECRATALALVQALLPGADPSSEGTGQAVARRAPAAVAREVSLLGAAAHLSLIEHLTDDLLPGAVLGDVLDVTATERLVPHLLMFSAKMATLLTLALSPDGRAALRAARVMHRLADSTFLRARASGPAAALLVRPARRGRAQGLVGQRFHLLLLPTLRLFAAMLRADAVTAAASRAPARRFLANHRDIFEALLSGGASAAQDAGAPWEESDEVLDERRLVLAALSALDSLEPDAPPPAPPADADSDAIDADIQRWVTALASSLLAQAGTGAFWQPLSTPPGAGASGGGAAGDAGAVAQRRARRRVTLLLQSCEVALVLLLRRERRLDPASAPLLDCTALGCAAPPGAGAGAGGARIDCRAVVQLLSRAVEHLCGAAAAPGVLGAASGGAGLTQGGAMSVWSRAQDLRAQAAAIRAEGGGPGAAVRLERVERDGREVARHMRCLLDMGEAALALLAGSLEASVRAAAAHAAAAHAALASPAAARSSWGVAGQPARGTAPGGALGLANNGSKHGAEAIWNRQRNGAVQRLTHFYRELSQDPEAAVEVDCAFLHRVSARLLAALNH